MKKVILFLSFQLLLNAVFAQDTIPKEELLIIAEEMPTYPGGSEEMLNWISRNVQYPEFERQKGISGTVYISFVVNKDGRITDPKVLKGVEGGIGLGHEALRLVQNMPPWYPGKQNGIPVNVQYTIPVKFDLAALKKWDNASFKSYSQKALEKVRRSDAIKQEQAIVYGNFIQRLGLSSGGYRQEIRLINVDSKEMTKFRVKPTFKSSKENTFCYHIKPGNYAILNYFWVESKPYGGKIYIEPIYKNIASSELSAKLKAGEIKEEDLKQYTFSIEANSVNYLGTWHFNKELVSFTDDKISFDKKISSLYKHLDFNKAKIVLPN